MLFRRHSKLSVDARSAVAELLRAPTFELIPLKNSMDQAALLPAGATVSVTASPAKGIEATVALCEQLQAAGFRAVPHLSARMIRDRAHLRELIAWLEGAGVDRAFVVGGDAKEPGAYPDGLSLLREMAEIGHPLAEIGIPGYPQGHAFIADAPLLEALHAKAAFASYMTTQLCFDPVAIGSWLAARRAEGMTLPVHVGVPGVAEPQRLLAITARIGVADTHRFLTKNARFVARLIRSGGFYRPDGLLDGIGPIAADPELNVVDFHLYTFNNVGPTETWRRKYRPGTERRRRPTRSGLNHGAMDRRPAGFMTPLDRRPQVAWAGESPGNSAAWPDRRSVSAATARRFLVRRHLLAPPRSLAAGPGERARRRRPARVAPVRSAGDRRAQPRPGPARARRRLPPVHHGRVALRDRALFEAYNKGLSILPVAELPFHRITWDRHHVAHSADTFDVHAPLVEELLERIRSGGRLSSTDVEPRAAIEWYWRPTNKVRAVLEALAEAGILGIAQREGNRRVYDLAERLFPAELLAVRPAERDQYRHRLLTRYRANGLLGASGQAEIFMGLGPGNTPFRAELRAELVEMGALVPVVVEGVRGVRFVVGSEVPVLDAAEAEVATQAGDGSGPGGAAMARLRSGRRCGLRAARPVRLGP